jgi:hypothetical protein
MLESVLTKEQFKTFYKRFNGYNIKCKVRYDDDCNNGHNSFGITAMIYDKDGRAVAGGCLHDEVARDFPELAKYIKWHFCSSDGPLHYVANTLYWIEKGNYDNARKSAIWPEVSDAELKSPYIESMLNDRLPALMQEFKNDVEELGFIY